MVQLTTKTSIELQPISRFKIAPDFLSLINIVCIPYQLPLPVLVTNYSNVDKCSFQ